MANQEQMEATVSLVARTAVSLMLPLWGILMLLAGLIWGEPWWVVCGAAVIGVGLILAVGNPVVWDLVSDMEMRPPRS